MPGQVIAVECLANKKGKLKAGASLDQTTGIVSGNTTVPYRVWTCGCLGPQRIFESAAAESLPLPNLGDSYQVPCCEETPIASLECTSWSMTSGPNKGQSLTDAPKGVKDAVAEGVGNICGFDCVCYYDFAFTYAPVVVLNGSGETKDPTKDKFWCPQITESSIAVPEVVENAVFKGIVFGSEAACCEVPPADTPGASGFDSVCVNRAINTCGPVINAAGQVFEIPIEKNRYLKSIRFRWPTLASISFDALLGTVNSAQVSLALTCPTYSRTYPADTLQLTDISSSSSQVEYQSGGVNVTADIFWNEVEFVHDPKGYTREILNQGTQRAVCAGADQPCCADPGQLRLPCFLPILDRDGVAVEEPANLDSAGDILPCDDAPRYIRYGVECDGDFTAIAASIIAAIGSPL